jgi:hypothetical protein
MCKVVSLLITTCELNLGHGKVHLDLTLVPSLRQLQVQRNLQLRIEEQGKCLQIMIEQQCKPGADKVLDASTSAEGSKLSSDPKESSTVKDVPNNSQNGTAAQAGAIIDEKLLYVYYDESL